MELALIAAAIAAAYFVYKNLAKPNHSDELTLLDLKNWISIYSDAEPLKASKMATALIVQSITVANNMGLGIPVKEFMQRKNRTRTLSTEVISGWLDLIHDEIIKDIPISEMYQMPARAATALAVLKLSDESAYKAFLTKN